MNFMFEWQEQYHGWAQRKSEILFLPRERRIHILELTCNVLYHIKILMTGFLCFSEDFFTTFRRFPKIFQNCSEGQTNVPEHFPRVSEIFRRLPKTFEENPRCFDDTLTKTSSISSHLRISYHLYQFVTTRCTTDFYIIVVMIMMA